MNEILNQVVNFLQENVLMANVLSGTTVVGFVGTAISLIKSQKKIIKTTTDDTKTLNEVVSLKSEVSSLKASQAQILAMLNKSNEIQNVQAVINTEAYLASNLSAETKALLAEKLATLKSSIPTNSNIPSVDINNLIPNISLENLQNLSEAQLEALKAKLATTTNGFDINALIDKATSTIAENKETLTTTATSTLDKLVQSVKDKVAGI
jgi:uncharacterized protein YdcH (DUF465 family)